MSSDTVATIGCDPEIVWTLSDKGTAPSMLPAGFVLNRLKKVGSSLITGDYKGYPCINTDAGLIFADGAGWELNPKPGDVPTVVDNLQSLLTTTAQVEKEVSTEDKVARVNITPAMTFDLDMLRIWNDEQLVQFGCDVDRSIWKRTVDPRNVEASTHQYRYFGAHIHLGYPLVNPARFYKDVSNVKKMIMLADAILGMSGLIMDLEEVSAAAQRRGVYGQPGVYRIQEHCIEYRTTSNCWLRGKNHAVSMLSMAIELPKLLDTELCEIIDKNGSELRKTLIYGGAQKAQEFLGAYILPNIDNNVIKRSLENLITLPRKRRYSSYEFRIEKDWQRRWEIKQ